MARRSDGRHGDGSARRRDASGGVSPVNAWRPEKIVSGGQTGVDRGALDAARTCGVPAGGWCPRGRRAEDGPIDPAYPLTETPEEQYAQRTAWNVRDSDGTLVLTALPPAGGTARTVEEARRQGKPCLVADAHGPEALAATRAWGARHGIRVLNVAGPRASEEEGAYEAACAFITALLASPGAAPR